MSCRAVRGQKQQNTLAMKIIVHVGAKILQNVNAEVKDEDFGM